MIRISRKDEALWKSYVRLRTGLSPQTGMDKQAGNCVPAEQNHPPTQRRGGIFSVSRELSPILRPTKCTIERRENGTIVERYSLEGKDEGTE